VRSAARIHFELGRSRHARTCGARAPVEDDPGLGLETEPKDGELSGHDLTFAQANLVNEKIIAFARRF
jgi:hypothetical protein